MPQELLFVVSVDRHGAAEARTTNSLSSCTDGDRACAEARVPKRGGARTHARAARGARGQKEEQQREVRTIVSRAAARRNNRPRGRNSGLERMLAQRWSSVGTNVGCS